MLNFNFRIDDKTVFKENFVIFSATVNKKTAYNHNFFNYYLCHKKASHFCNVYVIVRIKLIGIIDSKNGERGIRTPEPLLEVNSLAGSPIRPLLHLSKIESDNTWIIVSILTDGEGFEPPVSCPTTVFKTAAFDHSAIHP